MWHPVGKNYRRISILGVVLSAVFFFAVGFSASLTADDIFTRLISVDASGGYGTIIFEMHNPTSNNMPIGADLLKADAIDIRGNPTLSTDVFYLSAINRTHYTIDMASCVNVTFGNTTDLVCDKMLEYTFLDKRFMPLDKTIMLPAGESITIKFGVRWQPKLGFQSRNIQPFINYGGSDRYDYTGKELDAGTGLEYYGARYYDPIRSQFTQPDSNLPGIYDPQQLNRYSYVLNNPYKYTDRTEYVAYKE